MLPKSNVFKTMAQSAVVKWSRETHADIKKSARTWERYVKVSFMKNALEDTQKVEHARCKHHLVLSSTQVHLAVVGFFHTLWLAPKFKKSTVSKLEQQTASSAKVTSTTFARPKEKKYVKVVCRAKHQRKSSKTTLFILKKR
eukprot:TRINITY_DN26559_c0_g1_i1.p2 TRINITY_DN26559_c0_g1~~TRINITY_DN26559_c0_g1_i1.p2  ORF type:complete len:142 (-),score=7.60 TRINITY_DN26559_c0_g1_i1:305-730(-)